MQGKTEPKKSSWSWIKRQMLIDNITCNVLSDQNFHQWQCMYLVKKENFFIQIIIGAYLKCSGSSGLS